VRHLLGSRLLLVLLFQLGHQLLLVRRLQPDLQVRLGKHVRHSHVRLDRHQDNPSRRDLLLLALRLAVKDLRLAPASRVRVRIAPAHLTACVPLLRLVRVDRVNQPSVQVVLRRDSRPVREVRVQAKLLSVVKGRELRAEPGFRKRSRESLSTRGSQPPRAAGR
jgi:hypothetical protein